MSGDLQSAPEPFGTELEPHRETIVVKAKGEIDTLTAGQLRTQLEELLGAGFRRVVLDLRAVDFIDSSGLRAILALHSASRDSDTTFALIQGSKTRRLFELTGTTAALDFLDENEIAGGSP